MPSRRSSRTREPAPRSRARTATRGKRPGTARRVRLDTDERRSQILSLARRAFQDSSYDEVSIDDLARAAGISKGLMYHYFPTKRDLYVAGLRAIADEMITNVVSVPETLAPMERVRAGLDRYLDHVAANSRSFVSLMRGGIGSDPEVAAVIADTRVRFLQPFTDGGMMTFPKGPPALVRMTVQGWLTFVETASIEWAEKQEVERSQLRDFLVDTLFAALQLALKRV